MDKYFFKTQCPEAIKLAWETSPNRSIYAFKDPRIVNAWTKLSPEDQEEVQEIINSLFGQTIQIGFVQDNFY